MSDQSSRSARPSGKRRGDGAPAWWAALDRGDLPEDTVPPAPPRRWYEGEPVDTPLRDIAGIEGMPSRRRAWLINLAVVVVAALVIMLGLRADSPGKALVVGLLFGVPLVLAAITVAVAASRSR